MREIDRQIEQFLTHCSMKQLSKKTLKAYNQTLYLLANYLEQVHRITSAEQVKAFHISAYIGYLQERGKYTVACHCNHTQQNYPERRTDYKRSISKTTINNYIRNMRVFFNFLVEFDYIEHSPMRKIKQLYCYYSAENHYVYISNHQYYDGTITPSGIESFYTTYPESKYVPDFGKKIGIEPTFHYSSYYYYSKQEAAQHLDEIYRMLNNCGYVKTEGDIDDSLGEDYLLIVNNRTVAMVTLRYTDASLEVLITA